MHSFTHTYHNSCSILYKTNEGIYGNQLRNQLLKLDPQNHLSELDQPLAVQPCPASRMIWLIPTSYAQLFAFPFQKPTGLPNPKNCSELKHVEERKGKKKKKSPQSHIKRLQTCPFTRHLIFLLGSQGAPSDPCPHPSVPHSDTPGRSHLLPRLKSLGLLIALWSGNAQLRQSISESG